MKNIIFLSDKDTSDVQAWSGINYHLIQTISKKFKLIDIGKIKISFIFKIYFQLCKYFYKYIFKKNYLYQRTYFYDLVSSKNIQRKKIVNFSKTVPILTTSSMLAKCIGNIENNIYIYIDATYHQMIDYYPEFTNIPKKNIEYGISQELLAFKRAHKIFVASNWTKKSIEKDYGISKEIIEVVGLSSNIDDETKSIISFNEKVNNNSISILFVGVDWVRKGGDIVIELCDFLIKYGYDIQLSVVGCDIPKNCERSYVKSYGFLSKKVNSEKNILHKLYSDGDILLVPSRYECFGIVYEEAALYGLVPIGNKTGGVPDAIVKSGLCLDFYNDKVASFFKVQSLMERSLLNKRRFQCFNEIRSKPNSYELITEACLKGF